MMKTLPLAQQKIHKLSILFPVVSNLTLFQSRLLPAIQPTRDLSHTPAHDTLQALLNLMSPYYYLFSENFLPSFKQLGMATILPHPEPNSFQHGGQITVHIFSIQKFYS